MAYKNQILLGRITKVNGYDGTVSIKLEKVFIDNIPEMESVFIETEGKPVPFFISESEYAGGDQLKLRFEDYGTYEKAAEFAGCRVFLTTVPENNTLLADYETIAGFRVFLQDNRLIGTIKEVILNPGNDILVIMSPEKKEILVPLHEDFIIDFRETEKVIIMDIPDGLTEIN